MDMDTIIDQAIAWGTESAGVQVAILVTVALVVARWLWLGIRADWARWRGRSTRPGGVDDEHAAAFDRGMRRLLADLETRPEPRMTAYRRAA